MAWRSGSFFRYKLVDGTTHNKTTAHLPPAANGEAGRRQALNWFSRIFPESFFESLKQDLEIIASTLLPLGTKERITPQR